MTQADGSYQFDRFVEDIQTQEIQRLNYQSQILQTLDRQIWQNAGLTPPCEDSISVVVRERLVRRWRSF
jgi:hypothetical protein